MKKSDLLEIREVVKEVVSEAIEANNHVLKREIRDEFHSVLKGEIVASERRMITRMDQMETRLEKRMDEGFGAMTDLIDDGILPQIDEHNRVIAQLNHAVGIA